MRTPARFAAYAFAALQLVHSSGHTASATTRYPSAIQIPFVGCASDGQVGPLEAPKGNTMTVAIPEEIAHHLAYYKASEGPGVLAPRGWHCFGTYGSNGAALYVSPDSLSGTQLLSTTWTGFAGPAIELVLEEGGTYGRFGVARTVARVFPAHRKFVEDIIAEGLEPATEFPFGPYPSDQLVYRSKEIVEYETPANAVGLGTEHSRLQKNSYPIRGVAVFIKGEPQLALLAARLPEDQSALAPVIIQQVERDAAIVK